MTKAMPSDRRATQEELLLDYVKRLSKHRKGRRAVHLTLCRLTRLSRQPADLQQAARIMRTLLNEGEGQLFPLRNNDIVVIVAGVSELEIERRIMRVRMLMRNDENLKEAEEEDRDILAERYDLEREYDRFSDVVEKLCRPVLEGLKPKPDPADQPGRARSGLDTEEPDTDKPVLDLAQMAGPLPGPDPEPAPAPAPAPAASSEPSEMRPFGRHSAMRIVRNPPAAPTGPSEASVLFSLETALQSVDMAPFVSRSPVILSSPGSQPRRLLHEKQVAFKRLFGRLMPDSRTLEDPFLAAKARDLATARFLATLEDFERDGDMAVIVQASLASLADGRTLPRLAKLVPANARARVAFGFSQADVAIDINRYLLVRMRLAAAGFMCAILQVSPFAFAVTDWALLPAEFVALRYSKRLERAGEGAEADGVRRALKTVGPARAILSDCLLPASVDFGRQLGFRLFQGAAAAALVTAPA